MVQCMFVCVMRALKGTGKMSRYYDDPPRKSGQKNSSSQRDTERKGAGRSAGDGTRRPSGQGTRRPSGEGTGRTAGEGARRPSGERTGRTSGTGTTRTSGEGTRRPAGQGTRRPSGEAQRSNANRRPAERSREYDYQDEMRPRQKVSRREQAKKKRRRAILIVFELIILVLMGIILYGVLKVEKTGKVEIPEEKIVINDTVQQAEETTMKGYRNIALFGVDSTTGQLTKNTRTDSIMIASINMDTGECKLVSVYRDTYLNLSNDSYNKCNSAYAKGGPEQAINMLNMNLDMNITDFVTVGFAGLTDTIDALGGIEIDVTEAEIKHLNNYQISISGKTTDGVTYTAQEGVDYIPVTHAGLQTLNGLQATAYCRIRYVGDDFQRTERQRTVLMKIAEKAKKASPATLNDIANKVFSEVYTSLDLGEILEVLSNVSSYSITETAGFPEASMRATGTVGSKGSCVIPKDLESNVIWLHQFFFEAEDYVPSDTVKQCSEKIKKDTAGAGN